MIKPSRFSRMLRLGAVAAMILSVPGVVADAAPRKAAAKPNWIRSVTKTPEGGYVIGNPNARNKLVEYVSYMCSHCAQFAAAADKDLIDNFVAKGTTSVEFRAIPLNNLDIFVAMAVRCGAPTSYYARHKAVLSAQSAWMGKIEQADQAAMTRWETAAQSGNFLPLFQDVGLLPLFTANGTTAAQISQCLQSEAQWQEVVKLSDLSHAQAIAGTPSFFLNGKKLDFNEWPPLRAALMQPVK